MRLFSRLRPLFHPSGQFSGAGNQLRRSVSSGVLRVKDDLRLAPPELHPQILRQEEDWMVINKPAGWHSVTQPQTAKANDNSQWCIQEWILQQFPGSQSLDEAGLVQRLDFGTSGCILAGRNQDAVERLRTAIRGGGAGHFIPIRVSVNSERLRTLLNRHGIAVVSECNITEGARIRKVYLALVSGILQPDGEVEVYLRSRYRGSKKMTVSRKGDSKELAQIRWRVLNLKPSGITRRASAVGIGSISPVEVELIGPGRRHQIRAILSDLGAPLLGDVLYGGVGWDVEGIALHSRFIEIDSEAVYGPSPHHITAFFPQLDQHQVQRQA